MAGLIQTQINQQDPMKATGYDAERIELDPKTDTVEGRVEGIISKNSPLMQSAATRANQQSNRRGLLNSSMAVGAGQRAVIDTAMPMASQDAQTSFQAKNLNQQAGNRALEFGAGSANQFALQGMSGQQALEQIGAQGDIQSQLQQERGQIDKELQTADAANREALLNRQGEIDAELAQLQGGMQAERDQRLAEIEQERDARLAESEQILQGLRGEQAMQLSEIENEYGNLRRASESAASFYNQTANSIGSILANPDMDKKAKDALVKKQLELLEGGLSVIGSISNLDLTGLINFSGVPRSDPEHPNSPWNPDNPDGAVNPDSPNYNPDLSDLNLPNFDLNFNYPYNLPY